MNDYIVINNVTFQCYNVTYDENFNVYLRANNNNSHLCNSFIKIASDIKKIEQDFLEIAAGFKCYNSKSKVEYGLNCIMCNDPTIENVSNFLISSKGFLIEANKMIATNSINYDQFKGVYEDSLSNILALDSHISHLEDEVIEGIFEQDILHASFFNNFLMYITFGWYEKYSDNSIKRIMHNLDGLHSNINYLESHI